MPNVSKVNSAKHLINLSAYIMLVSLISAPPLQKGAQKLTLVMLIKVISVAV